MDLAEIQFPNSFFFNVLEDKVWIHCYPKDTEEPGKVQKCTTGTLLAWLQELIVDFINEMNKTLMLKEAVMELYTMPRNEPGSGFTKEILKLESASSEKNLGVTVLAYDR